MPLLYSLCNNSSLSVAALGMTEVRRQPVIDAQHHLSGLKHPCRAPSVKIPVQLLCQRQLPSKRNLANVMHRSITMLPLTACIITHPSARWQSNCDLRHVLYELGARHIPSVKCTLVPSCAGKRAHSKLCVNLGCHTPPHQYRSELQTGVHISQRHDCKGMAVLC